MSNDTVEHVLPNGKLITGTFSLDLFENLLEHIGEIKESISETVEIIDKCLVPDVGKWQELMQERGELLLIRARGDLESVDIVMVPKAKEGAAKKPRAMAPPERTAKTQETIDEIDHALSALGDFFRLLHKDDNTAHLADMGQRLLADAGRRLYSLAEETSGGAS